MRTVLITLIGPERTTDLVVDADTNVEALLPNLLVAAGVPEPARGEPGWGVALMGKQPIELQHRLEQSGVLDGAVLVLRREAEAPQDPVASPRATGGPAGSPLERTRALIEQETAAGGRRGRLSLQLPDRALVSDGTRSAQEPVDESAGPPGAGPGRGVDHHHELIGRQDRRLHARLAQARAAIDQQHPGEPLEVADHAGVHGAVGAGHRRRISGRGHDPHW